MTNLVVGIDLGTTNSAIALYINKELKILENIEGDYTTPSFVYFFDNEKLVVGKHGKMQAARKPDQGISEIKRLIGRQFWEVEQYISNLPFQVINRAQDTYIYLEKYQTYKSPEDICSYILKKIKTDIDRKIKGKPITKAVITVPAHFNVSQRRVTLEAAKKAGFEVLKLLNEPTAAALNYYYEHNDKNPEKKICLVYDMGGGTFDVAILEKNGQNIDIMSIDGDSHLGGHDFDNIIMNYVIEQLKISYNLNPDLGWKHRRRLLNECVTAKEVLSGDWQTSVVIEGFDYDNIIDIKLTREKFEQLAMPLFKRTIDIVDRCITNIGLTKNHIDEVILAGGSTRIPKLQEMLSDYFDGKPLNKTLHPEECVAKGAALQAAMLSQSSKQAIKRFTVTEVASSSLGVGDVANKMDFIIKKNTKIPTKGSVTHATIYNEQKATNLKIYEGERLYVKRNVCLGNFKITNLTPAPPGKCKIKITMSIDINGILTVTAKEISTDNTKNLEIAYSKANTAVLGKEVTDEEDLKREEERFAEYAKIHQYLMTFVAAIEYNFKEKKVTAHDMDVLYRTKEIHKNIIEMEDSTDITKLKMFGKKLLQLCEPIIKKYSFKNVPQSREIKKKIEDVSTFFGELNISDDSDDDRYLATRKVEDKTGFLFRH